MTRRSRTVGYGGAAALVVAGAACAALISGTLGQVLAMALIGLGLVLVVSLLFAEVGFSEDRERARSQGDGGAPRRRLRPRARPGESRGLDRRRGHRRSL
jgi:hypothetical protein